MLIKDKYLYENLAISMARMSLTCMIPQIESLSCSYMEINQENALIRLNEDSRETSNIVLNLFNCKKNNLLNCDRFTSIKLVKESPVSKLR